MNMKVVMRTTIFGLVGIIASFLVTVLKLCLYFGVFSFVNLFVHFAKFQKVFIQICVWC